MNDKLAVSSVAELIVRKDWLIRPMTLCRRNGATYFSHKPSGGNASKKAFSLVEVVIAIGIVSFALLPMLGLLPIGLSTFKKAIDTTVISQIVQKIGNEAQQSDFDGIQTYAPNEFRYFDDQGTEVGVATKANAIYQARLIVIADLDNPHRKRILIQVARNPSGAIALKEEILSGGVVVWSNSNVLPVFSQTLLVARISSIPNT